MSAAAACAPMCPSTPPLPHRGEVEAGAERWLQVQGLQGAEVMHQEGQCGVVHFVVDNDSQAAQVGPLGCRNQQAGNVHLILHKLIQVQRQRHLQGADGRVPLLAHPRRFPPAGWRGGAGQGGGRGAADGRRHPAHRWRALAAAQAQAGPARGLTVPLNPASAVWRQAVRARGSETLQPLRRWLNSTRVMGP